MRSAPLNTAAALTLAALLTFGCASTDRPFAEVSATAVDFGDVGCGAGLSVQVATLTNRGMGPMSFLAQISSGEGFTVSPTDGTLASGESIDLLVGAEVPSSAAAGAVQQGTLSLTTSDAAHANFDLALSARPSGATLALNPAAANFGVYPVNTQAPDLPLTLTNSGNASATVNFSTLADPQFALDWSGSPNALVLAAGASTTLHARFRAGRIQPATTQAAVSVVGSTCGVSATAIPMTGQGTNGVVGFSTTDVFFGTGGKVNCGTQAANQTFTITNSGNLAFSWTATRRKGAASPFTFSPTSGTVPANGGSITVTVSTVAIPAATSTALDAWGDTLDFVTDAANDTGHPIALHQTANGAVLSFSPGAVDFGLVPINNTSNAPLAVVNEGSADATVTLASDNAKFSLNPVGSSALLASSATQVTATFAPGASVVPETANVSVSVAVGDVLCAPLPTAVTMTGLGTNGSVSYTPVALDWAGVNCGTTGPAKTVTFKNTGNQSYTITPQLGRGGSSPFTVVMNPANGMVVQGGGTVVVTVTPSAIPQTSPVTPNLYGDTLTVTTDVAGDSAHDIALRMTARGTIFAISATALNFGSVTSGATGNAQFTATNNGNAAGGLNFAAGQPSVFTLPQNSMVNPNTSSSQNGAFSPPSAATYSDTATIAVTAGTVLCQPLPFTSLNLTGVGTGGNVVAVSATSLTFGSGGLVPCGSQAPAQTFTVTNNSGQSLVLTLALTGGVASPYTVSGPPSVAMGATATITVTPRLVPQTSSTAPDGFADTLSVTAAGGPVNEVHTLALHQTAQGAVLTLNPAGLSFSVNLTQSQQKNFTVNNAGNLPAAYTLTLAGTNASNFGLSPTSGTASAGGSVSQTVTFSAPLLGGTGARSANISLASGAGLCAPLPSALGLSGTIN